MTTWDDQLSHLLSPALAVYELDRIGSITFGNEEFQESIKRYVPEGHTFKAYPVQFNHTNADKIMVSLVKAGVSSDILSTRGDQVRFGLRVKVVPYPNNV
jgi:centrosomal protein CEP76